MKNIKIFSIENFANLFIVSIVVVPMILDNAPFWAIWASATIMWMINKVIDWIKYK